MKRAARAWPAALALVFVVALATAQRGARPLLILISFDGFRWDYIERRESPNLEALAARGVRAEGLIPSFPSVTFPNHYTIVTGLYPDHHGIIANSMQDPAWPERFSMSSVTSRDPRWWGGEPLWATARKHGLRSAAVFWPGSEAPIGGGRPDSWIPFDDGMPNVDRVSHALEALAVPEAERPSLVTIYFSEADSAGHDYGPDSAEVADAIRHLDASLGLLEIGLRELKLLDRATIVVTSDHGMEPLSDDRVVFLDDILDLTRVDVVDWESVAQIRPKTMDPVDVADARRALKSRLPTAVSVFSPADMASFHYGANARIQPIVLLASPGWEITSHERCANALARGRKRGGAHGYDPRQRSMHGVFVAAGPGLRRGLVVPRFENVHLYDFLCAVLGVVPAPNDGDPRVTRGFLTR